MARAFSAVLSRQMATSVGKADSRKKLMGGVRAACARKGICDDDRKAIQEEVTGKASLADMSLSEIGKVLDHLNRDRPKANPDRAHIGKIRALWWTLYWLGDVAEPNDTALDKFVQRQTGISALRFLDHRKASSVIEALKSMATRGGVKWPDAAMLASIVKSTPDCTMARLERHAVLRAIWHRLRDARVTISILYIDYIQQALGLSLNHWAWTERELDEAIRILGKNNRHAMHRAALDADA